MAAHTIGYKTFEKAKDLCDFVATLPNKSDDIISIVWGNLTFTLFHIKT